MKRTYITKKFKQATVDLIDQANRIIEEYAKQGFDLTLRQLYYQFVSRDLIDNTQKEYSRLGAIINDARLAGLVDWLSIVDRTRNLQAASNWSDPAEIVETCAQQFRVDRWAGQPYRPEVWIEKDALVGVIQGVCDRMDVPYFSCRGYTSQSEMWSASQRLLRYARRGQKPMIIHLGDHDPSGIDMSRDIFDRLSLFMTTDGAKKPRVERIALNMDQVDRYDPPPNPTKLTDSRASSYLDKYGRESWELDALEPSVLAKLIEDTIKSVRDEKKFLQRKAEEQQGRDTLRRISSNWVEVQVRVGNLSIEGEPERIEIEDPEDDAEPEADEDDDRCVYCGEKGATEQEPGGDLYCDKVCFRLCEEDTDDESELCDEDPEGEDGKEEP